MSKEEWLRLSITLNEACKSFLKQSTQYKVLREAQKVVQAKRQQLFLTANERKAKEKAALLALKKKEAEKIRNEKEKAKIALAAKIKKEKILAEQIRIKKERAKAAIIVEKKKAQDFARKSKETKTALDKIRKQIKNSL